MLTTTTGLPSSCMHWIRCAVPGDWPSQNASEHVASLGHLVIAAHACDLAEALPVGLEALPRDLFAPGPALPECVSAPRTTREDLRDAVAIRRQHLAQVLVVGERV